VRRQPVQIGGFLPKRVKHLAKPGTVMPCERVSGVCLVIAGGEPLFDYLYRGLLS
jgi:hypothetical protein